jgi:hypothetical protein
MGNVLRIGLVKTSKRVGSVSASSSKDAIVPTGLFLYLSLQSHVSTPAASRGILWKSFPKVGASTKKQGN